MGGNPDRHLLHSGSVRTAGGGTIIKVLQIVVLLHPRPLPAAGCGPAGEAQAPASEGAAEQPASGPLRRGRSPEQPRLHGQQLQPEREEHMMRPAPMRFPWEQCPASFFF